MPYPEDQITTVSHLLVSESDNTFRLRESLSVDGMKEIIENHALSVNDFLFHKDDRVSVLPVADAREIVAAYNAVKNSEAFMSDVISLRDMVIIGTMGTDKTVRTTVLSAEMILDAYNEIKNSEAFMSGAISLRDMVIISNYPANPRFHYYKYPQAVVLSRLFARQIAETKSPRGRLQQIRNLVLDPYDEADDTGCFMAKCDLGFFNNQQ